MTPLRFIAVAAAAWVGLHTSACAADVALVDGRYVHRRWHWSIEDPTRLAEGWRAEPADGATLTFRGPGGAVMSLVQKCGRPVEEPRILSRELLVALDAPQRLSEGPVEVGGAPGWALTARAAGAMGPVQIKAVTRRLGDCTLDWVLVTPGPRAADEALFDRWWASFRAPGPDAAAGAGR